MQQQDPFAAGTGPGEASWQRDANDLGFKHVNFNVKKEEKPEIAAFSDLFKTGANKFKTTHSPKSKIDLSYNPGPAQQPAQ